MVALYVGGKLLGSWAESEHKVSELTAQNLEIELRDENGKVIGRLIPPELLVPWDPNVTREEINRRLAGPFITFDELKKRLGWE